MGPWIGLAKLFAREAGKKMGKRVKADVNASQIKWTHSDKIKELKTDSELSPTYLQELIAKSSSKKHLMELEKYLTETTKIGNLDKRTWTSLLKKVDGKLDKIKEDEVLKQLIKAAKEKAAAHVDDITNLF
jgi:hypothetical protein